MAETLRIPITVTNGRAEALTQDDDIEVAQAASVLLMNYGACPDLDGWQPLFGTDPEVAAAEAVALIDEYEPRMDAEAAAELAADRVATIRVEG